MSKKVFIYASAVLFLILVIFALARTKLLQFSAMGAAAATMVLPPETVTAAQVKAEVWENTLVATGSLAAVQGVTVGAEVPGKIVKIAFAAGATVSAGELLVQLDISSEVAQLRALDAGADLAKLNLERAQALRLKNSNAASDLDLAEAQAKQAVAVADGLRATIAKKTIRAPFAGRLGLRLVNLGQILREGDPIATLQTLDPIYVNFSLPQQRLGAISVGATVRVTSNPLTDEVVVGKITAIAPEVDAATRNVRVQATLANASEMFRPGMFATVTIVLPDAGQYLVLPATALLYAPYGDSVFVVDEKKDGTSGLMQKIIRQQFVRVGPARGDFVTIQSGLKAGETVVTTGAFKLRPGLLVVIDNKLAPDAKLAPKPDNS